MYLPRVNYRSSSCGFFDYGQGVDCCHEHSGSWHPNAVFCGFSRKRTATDEQKSAANEIVKTVSEINELSQRNATGSEEMTANAEDIAAMAETLSLRVDFFKV